MYNYNTIIIMYIRIIIIRTSRKWQMKFIANEIIIIGYTVGPPALYKSIHGLLHTPGQGVLL